MIEVGEFNNSNTNIKTIIKNLDKLLNKKTVNHFFFKPTVYYVLVMSTTKS